MEAKGGSTVESEAAATESHNEETDGNATNGADVEQESEERIRGGGKVTGERGRNARRAEPYRSNAGGKPGEVDRSHRVYVGNLAWEVSWQDLKDHMKTTGHEVARANVMMSPDGRSKGCGIVEFATLEGAQEAVKSLNDTELSGRQIFVREDREDRGSGGGLAAQKTTGGGSNAHRFSAGDQAQSHRVYVGNLSWDVAWQDLKDHMRDAGEVNHAEVICESNGRSKGCGIVEFATAEEAQKAISTLTDTELKGRMIFVREDRETSSGSSGGQGQRSNNCSVYVRNLSFETSWQDLKDHMRKAGNVDQATLLSDSQGNSAGTAVVVYQRPQDAARAIRELQNSELSGRNLSLREDRNQSGGRGHGGGRGSHGGRGRSGGRGGDRAGGGGSGEQGSQLFVGNLSFETTWKELKDHFRQCGDVERAEVVLNPEGRSKGFGTVQFYKQSDAEQAIQRLNGVDLMDRSLEVRVSTKKSR